MAELIRFALEFSQRELDELMKRLASVSPELSPREQLLLFFIFAAAKDNVSRLFQPLGTDQPELEVTEFKKEIVEAFIPTELDADANHVITARISPARISSAKPKRRHPPPRG